MAPALLLAASVSWRYPGVTPRGGTGPDCETGQALSCGVEAVAPVRQVAPLPWMRGSATVAPVNVSLTRMVAGAAVAAGSGVTSASRAAMVAMLATSATARSSRGPTGAL